MQTETMGSSGSTAAAAVMVTRVSTAAEKKEFINFQYEVYRNQPNFVPPLLMDREAFLNEKKNPWFEFGKVELFLARRGGKLVGRIAALEDPRYNEFHNVKYGWFGLFECIDDAEVAKALLNEAEKWVKARGLNEILGPANFSSNNEWGFLVNGFDKEPVLMMPYNPEYYLKLIEQAGYGKAKDLWAWEVDLTKPVPEKIARVAEKVRGREGITVRQANMKDWDNEVRRIKDIYNDAWEKNWGFVPMTDKEFDHLAKDLKMILIPEMTLIAEVKGEAVAFAITLPDANQAIKKANGRLFPFGLVKMLLAMKKIRFGRLAILGIKAGYRKRGLDAILMCDTFNNGRKLGWYGGEIGWTLEDNDMVNRAIELFGAKKYKTYRVYSKLLEGAALKN
ncbi:MAG: N-acetyltransferase [Myxococcaceae bacterium]